MHPDVVEYLKIVLKYSTWVNVPRYIPWLDSSNNQDSKRFYSEKWKDSQLKTDKLC